MKDHRLKIIFLTVFMDLLGFGLVIPLSPYLATQFHATPLQVGFLMSIYSLMQFLFSPIWGRLSDYFGRRPILLISLFGSAVSYLGFAFADTFEGLFISRMFAGIATANVATAMAYIADITPQSERSKSMGLIGAAFGLGFVIGPAAGGFLATIGESIGSAPPFGMSFSAVGAALVCFLNFVLACFYLTESLSKESRARQRSGGKRIGFHVITERINLTVKSFSKPIVGHLLVVYLLAGISMASMESTLALHVKNEFGWSAAKASYMFAIVGVLLALFQGLFIRKWMPRFGERRLALTGLLVASFGMACLGFAHEYILMGVAIVGIAAGISMVNPSITGSLSLVTAADEQGGVLGQSQSVSALGRIIGPAAGGGLYEFFNSSSPFFLSSLCFAVGAVVLFSIFQKLPETGKKVG